MLSDRIFVGHSTVEIANRKRAAQIAALQYQCDPTDYNAHTAAVASSIFFSMVEAQSKMAALDSRVTPEELPGKAWRMWRLQSEMALIVLSMLPDPDEHRENLRHLVLDTLGAN